MANRFSPTVLPDPRKSGAIPRGLLQGVERFFQGREFVRERNRREAFEDLERAILEAEAAQRGIEVPGTERIKPTRQETPGLIDQEAAERSVSLGRGFPIPKRMPRDIPGPTPSEEARASIEQVFANTARPRGGSAEEPEALPGQFIPQRGGFTRRAIFAHGPDASPDAAAERLMGDEARILDEEFNRPRSRLLSGIDEASLPVVDRGPATSSRFKPIPVDELVLPSGAKIKDPRQLEERELAELIADFQTAGLSEEKARIAARRPNLTGTLLGDVRRRRETAEAEAEESERQRSLFEEAQRLDPDGKIVGEFREDFDYEPVIRQLQSEILRGEREDKRIRDTKAREAAQAENSKLHDQANAFALTALQNGLSSQDTFAAIQTNPTWVGRISFDEVRAIEKEVGRTLSPARAEREARRLAVQLEGGVDELIDELEAQDRLTADGQAILEAATKLSNREASRQSTGRSARIREAFEKAGVAPDATAVATALRPEVRARIAREIASGKSRSEVIELMQDAGLSDKEIEAARRLLENQ